MINGKASDNDEKNLYRITKKQVKKLESVDIDIKSFIW